MITVCQQEKKERETENSNVEQTATNMSDMRETYPMKIELNSKEARLSMKSGYMSQD